MTSRDATPRKPDGPLDLHKVEETVHVSRELVAKSRATLEAIARRAREQGWGGSPDAAMADEEPADPGTD